MAISNRLFVGNLNFETTAETIGHLFETVGAVDNVKILSKNGKSLGYGFIEMADVEQAQRAQLQFNGHILEGRQIRVEIPKESKMKQNQNYSKGKMIHTSLNPINQKPLNKQYNKLPLISQQNNNDQENEKVNLNSKVEQIIPQTNLIIVKQGMIQKEIPQYNQNHLHQIIQDIHSIIESKTINDEQKEIKLKEKLDELKKKEQDELRNIFIIDEFNYINSIINKCNTNVENALLGIIDFIASQGYQQQNSNLFFNNILCSGLLNKMQNLIIQTFSLREIDNNETTNSDIIEQLTQIYLKIMKNQQIDIEIIESIMNGLDQNIQYTLTRLRNIDMEIKQGRQINNQELDKDLIRTTSEIRAFEQFRQYCKNNGGFKNSSKLALLMKEKITPFVHINCVDELHCSLRISVPNSGGIQDLKVAVFILLANFSLNNQDFKDQLINNHIILLHLSPLIIEFNNKYQLNKKNNENQQQIVSVESPQFIPDLFTSLIQLSQSNLTSHFIKDEDSQMFGIRKISLYSLFPIQNFGDEKVYMQLSTQGFAYSLTMVFSTAGGFAEGNNFDILISLIKIDNFIFNLYNGRKISKRTPRPSFPSQPILAKNCIEQIEEQGGFEEIEAHLTNQGKDGNDYIKFNAIEVKGDLSKFFIDGSNPKPRWY